jgi:hypothetical protein
MLICGSCPSFSNIMQLQHQETYPAPLSESDLIVGRHKLKDSLNLSIHQHIPIRSKRRSQSAASFQQDIDHARDRLIQGREGRYYAGLGVAKGNTHVGCLQGSAVVASIACHKRNITPLHLVMHKNQVVRSEEATIACGLRPITYLP